MAQVLRQLTPRPALDLLVGLDPADDAAVWRLDDARALVATVDVITPVVDDARTWGRIAAANAASDVYAMGGRPLFALNVIGWNSADLPLALLVEVLEGAAELAASGGWVAVGGHTIDDPEPKFGLAVLGEVHPDRILRREGLRAGDALVLTKPLGTGIVTTALKRAAAPPGLVDAAVRSMSRLNDVAAAVARDAGASGATDVSGFGLLGHLRAMAGASAVDVDLDVAAVPLLDGVYELAAAGFVPGGTRRNFAWAGEVLDRGGIDDLTAIVLADAQTSGGLLFGAAPRRAAAALERLYATGHAAAVVGRARRGEGRIHLHG